MSKLFEVALKPPKGESRQPLDSSEKAPRYMAL
jgi:hypothetical protein